MRHLMPILAIGAMILTAGAATADLGDHLFKLLADDGAEEDLFGDSVAISGTTAIVGAWGDDDNGTDSGAAYLFDTTTGQQIAKLLPDDGAAEDKFGFSVAISGDIAIVGARLDDDNGEQSGSAYLFDATTGRQIAKLLPDDGARDDLFGTSVAISGTTAIVGAKDNDDNGDDSGSAYLFDLTTGRQIAKLLPDDGAEDDLFGVAVAISENIAIVGASGDDNGPDEGSAYLFDTTSGQQLFKLLADDGVLSERFGESVAIGGGIAIVGDSGRSVGTGSAYLFDITTGHQIVRLFPSDPDNFDWFGDSVGISDLPGDDVAIVGAHGSDPTNRGAAYVFDTNTGEQLRKLTSYDGVSHDHFGRSVAISGNTVIVGADGDDDNGIRSGSAYLIDAGSPHATLTACSITFGSTDNPPCDVANLIDVDGIDQILRSQFGFTAFEPNLTEIVINGTAPGATVIASIKTRDGSDTANVVAKVKARNYVTNSIVEIAQYNVSFPGGDTSHTTLVNGTDFIKINGEVEVRLRYVAPAIFAPAGFTIGLDQVRVMVQ